VTEELPDSELERLEEAMRALEGQRAILGDAVVDAAKLAIHEKLSTLREASQAASQRKLVTILFMDIANSTAITQDLDPEDTMAIMDRALKRLAKPIDAHGGRVTRFMGDGYLALFGAPMARENDPEMAVRAGLQILAEAKLLAQELAANWKIADFGVRVGIDTGPAVIGGETEAENTIMGATVNLAARLESAAKPGTVVISQRTFRHVRDGFDVEQLEPIQAKGFTTPVQAYWVRRVRPRAFRITTWSVAGVETRMIGRDAELLMLHNLLRDMIEDAEVRVATIVGDAGVGKSRLLYEFERSLDQVPEDISFFRGRATSETESTPFGLIRRMLSLRFGILESDNSIEVREKFRAGMAGVLDPDQAEQIGQLLGLDFSTSPTVQAQLGNESFGELATNYLLKYLRAVSAEPTLILLEDIHWADDSSLSLLDRLATEVFNARLLLVCMARPALYDRRPRWGEGREAHTRINLKPLSRRASRTLVAEILREAGNVPIELRNLIVGTAEGNPFYIREMVKMLIDDGVIRVEPERWTIEQERLANLRMPPTLTGILQARLDSLPPGERQVLQRASVVGRLFWNSAVAELSRGTGDAGNVDSLLEALRRRELVLRREHSVFDGTDEYTFNHNILRDITYETVLLKERRRYHAQVAKWLESAAGERVGEYLSLIAGHFELAGETNQAANALERLGEDRLQIGAFRDAARALQKTLALLSEGDAGQAHVDLDALSDREILRRASLLVNLGIAFNRVGDHVRARENLHLALDAARRVQHPQTEIAALNRLAQMACEQGAFDKAQRYLDESLTLSRKQDDRACTASTLSMLGTTAWRWGDLDLAEACCREAMAIFEELSNRRQIALMQNVLGIVAVLREDFGLAEKRFGQGLQLAREVSDRQLTADLLGNLGYLYHHKMPNLGKAKRYYTESLAIAEEIGHRAGVTSCRNNLGQLHVLMGDHQVALDYLRSALTESLAIGALPLTLEAIVGVAQQQLEVGQYETAAELVAMVLNHPALEMDVSQLAENVLGVLRRKLPAAQLEEATARGRKLKLEQVVMTLEAKAMWTRSDAGK
jgi:class 3 adenylate cyclase/tetratricopeptide (TPR) repeat protein